MEFYSGKVTPKFLLQEGYIYNAETKACVARLRNAKPSEQFTLPASGASPAVTVSVYGPNNGIELLGFPDDDEKPSSPDQLHSWIERAESAIDCAVIGGFDCALEIRGACAKAYGLARMIAQTNPTLPPVPSWELAGRIALSRLVAGWCVEAEEIWRTLPVPDRKSPGKSRTGRGAGKRANVLDDEGWIGPWPWTAMAGALGNMTARKFKRNAAGMGLRLYKGPNRQLHYVDVSSARSADRQRLEKGFADWQRECQKVKSK